MSLFVFHVSPAVHPVIVKGLMGSSKDGLQIRVLFIIND
jgi:hypothetical protein